MSVRQELKPRAEKLSQEGKSSETLREIGERVPHMISQLLGGHSSNSHLLRVLVLTEYRADLLFLFVVC